MERRQRRGDSRRSALDFSTLDVCAGAPAGGEAGGEPGAPVVGKPVLYMPPTVFLTSDGRVLAAVETWVAGLVVFIATLLVVLVALLSVRLGYDNTIANDVEWIRGNLSGTAS